MLTPDGRKSDRRRIPPAKIEELIEKLTEDRKPWTE